LYITVCLVFIYIHAFLKNKIQDHADSTQEEDTNQPSVSVDSAEDGTTTDVNDQVDEMMVQLWSIINEKNDILRRQTELEYLRRGHRLEVLLFLIYILEGLDSLTNKDLFYFSCKK
jgi:hypothetical protein